MAGDADIVALTIDIVSAFVGYNNIRTEDMPAFIASTHDAIKRLNSAGAPVPDQPVEDNYAPAVSARKSLGSKDHIISLIDGKPYKTLRRHLTTHGLTPETYRAHYKLPANYPMVAETYSAKRRDLARKIGLGRKPGPRLKSAAPASAPATAEPKGAPPKPRAAKASV